MDPDALTNIEKVARMRTQFKLRMITEWVKKLNIQKSISASELIFIPQANSPLGFKAMVLSLEAGYNVRAAVPTAAVVEWFENLPLVKSHLLGKTLDVVIVADLTKTQAVKEFLDGVTGIIYNDINLGTSASDRGPYLMDLITPICPPQTAIMNAANTTSSVKRVIFTSVAEALISWDSRGHPQSISHDSSLGMSVITPFSSQEEARRSIETLRLQSVQSMALRSDLALVILLSAPTLGTEICHSGTKVQFRGWGIILKALLGLQTNAIDLGAFVDMNDVALCQLRALRPDVPGSTPSHPRAHIMAANIPARFEWESAKELVANFLPENLKNEYFPCTGSMMTKPWPFNTSREKKFFNWQFKSLEESLVDIISEHLWYFCNMETHRNTGTSPSLAFLQEWLYRRWALELQYLDRLQSRH